MQQNINIAFSLMKNRNSVMDDERKEKTQREHSYQNLKRHLLLCQNGEGVLTSRHATVVSE